MDQWEALREKLIQQKKNDALMNAAKSNDMAALKETFPTAQDLVNYDMSKKRSYSSLETLVTYSSPEFIKQVFDGYFPDNAPETSKLKDQFLRARTYTNERLNYRYFSHYLPEELTTKVAEAYNEPKPQARKPLVTEVPEPEPEKKSFAERIKQVFNRQPQPVKDTRPRMEQIYDIIKEQNQSLAAYRHAQDQKRQLQLRNSDEKPVQRYHTSDNPHNSLIIETEATPSLYIRKIHSIDSTTESFKEGDFVRLDLENPLANNQEKPNILHSLYVAADFPEDYMWSLSALQQFKREYDQVVDSDAVNLAQVKEFAMDGGRFFIESERSHDDVNTNDRNYRAFAGKRDGTSAIVFNAESYEQQDRDNNVLLHELIHRADLNSAETFSSTELFKAAAVLMIAEDENGLVAKKADHVNACYGPDSFYCELLAYMNEESKENLAYSQLATAVRDLYGTYTEAKVHHDDKTMEQIASFQTRDIVAYGNIFRFEQSGHTQIPDKESLQTAIPQMTQQLNMLNTEIKSRQQLEKSGIELPDKIKAAESYFPVYTIYQQAQEDFKSGTTAAAHIEHMEQGLQDAMKIDDDTAFLQKMIYLSAYLDTYKKGSEKTFEQIPEEKFSQAYRDELTKNFQNEIIYLKAAEKSACTRQEALLAQDLGMPIGDFMQHKQAGQREVATLQTTDQLKEKLQTMMNQAHQSGKDEDNLKLLGAIETAAARTGIANPLGYEINSALMVGIVGELCPEFIDKKLPTAVTLKPPVEIKQQTASVASQQRETTNSPAKQIGMLRGTVTQPKSPVRQTSLDTTKVMTGQNIRK